MVSLARKHPLFAYFVLAYAITWMLVSPLALEGLGLTGELVPPSWHVLGALGPVSAAFAVTAMVDGKAGVRELVRRMALWRVGRTWFSLAVFSPFLLFVVAVGVLLATGTPPHDVVSFAPGSLEGVAWIVGVFYGIGEEPGWRGFALPRLQRGRSALSATFILAALWFLWHAPFFFYRYELGVGSLIGFFLGLLAGAIWLTCLYNSTGGSVLMCILWHTTFNVVNLPEVVSAGALAIMSVLVMVAGVIVVMAFKPATLSPAPKQVGPPR